MAKYMIVGIIIMILTMFFSPFNITLLAEEGVDRDIQMLQQIGMLKGPEGGVTEEYLKSKVKRFQVAIMLVRLTGNESHIADYIGKRNFIDADLVDKKTAKYLSFLYDHPELGMRGIGKGKFDPNSVITAKDYYKVMLYALGYKSSTDVTVGDFEYKSTLLFAEAKGLSKVALADPFTIQNMVTATVETLKAKTKGSEKTLASKLIELGVIDPYSIIEHY